MADTAERLAFRQGIIDQPADYAKRIAFSKWLQEHGEHEEAETWRAAAPAFFTGLDLGQVT